MKQLSKAQSNVLVAVVQSKDGHYKETDIQPNTLKSLVDLALLKVVDGHVYLRRVGDEHRPRDLW